MLTLWMSIINLGQNCFDTCVSAKIVNGYKRTP